MSWKRANLIAAGRAQIVGDEFEVAGAGPGAALARHNGHPGHPGHHPGHEGHRMRHPYDGYPYPPPGYVIPGAPSAAYARGPGPTRVIDRQPTDERSFPIGFVSDGNIPAAQSALVTVQPQVIFRGERLAVPNSIVLNFQLVDIKVGKDSQLAAPGNMPTECFSNISVGVRMQLDTSEPGITLTLVVENTDLSNPHPFASVLYGTVIE